MQHFRYICCFVLAGISLQHATAADVSPDAILAEKQEIIRRIKEEPASLYPGKIVGLTEAAVLRDLFEGLVNEDANGKINPCKKEKLNTTDSQTHIFILRKNARWSNGDHIRAEDFVYSWRRLVDNKTLSPFAWYAQFGFDNAEQIINVKLPPEKLGVTAVDKGKLKIYLSKPIPYFSSLMASFSMFPVHQATVARYGNDCIAVGNLAGNGAFNPLHSALF